MSEIARDGFPIVFTADRTLMADYRVLFDGMLSTSQTSTTPDFLMRLLLARPAWGDGLRARRAPIGLRRIEAALLDDGLLRQDVVIVSPMDLPRAIGRNTRVIGVSSGDPLGVGMNSTTMTGIAAGRAYTRDWFRGLMDRIASLRQRAPDAALIVGGPGAWQLLADEQTTRRFRIDGIVTGYGERRIARLLVEILRGGEVPQLTSLGRDEQDDVPCVRGPTSMGVVEISRGCGMGCGFCTLRDVPMNHLPVETILADVRTNLAEGPNVALISEDFFRYGAKGPSQTEPGVLLDLLRRLRGLDGLGLMQVDHANVASVAGYADDELEEVCRRLTGDAPRHSVWVNLGVESASGGLLQANGGAAKMRPWSIEEWPDACLEQVRRLSSAGFLPMVSLVVGLPGETQADVEATIGWVRRLRGVRVLIFPLFHAPVRPGRRPFDTGDMTEAHWRLFRECYRFNFRWTLPLVWRSQTAGRVPLLRRLAMQALGVGNILFWNALFLWRSGGLCL